MDVTYIEDDILDDVELYTGAPDFDGPQTDDEAQEDDADVPVGLGFLARATNAVRDFRETLSWYATHRMDPGFDPDNMCLKICRTARNIPAKHLTAKEAQDNTPEQFRTYAIEDLRQGMVVFFDDPTDSNRAGHIVTVAGRRRGVPRKELGSLVLETNSVVSDQIVRVAGDYFAEHWGDDFQFGANFLNGVEFDVRGSKTQIERFNNGGPVYNLKLLKKAAENGREHAGRVLNQIERQVKRLPDSPKLPRVREFKQEWRDTGKIDMELLDMAVRDRSAGLVRQVRDELRRLIDTLPDE